MQTHTHRERESVFCSLLFNVANTWIFCTAQKQAMLFLSLKCSLAFLNTWIFSPAQKQATFFFIRRRNQQQSSMGQIGCQLQINLPFHSEILSISNLPALPPPPRCVYVSVGVCETRHAKHVLYTGCQSRIAVFVISFYVFVCAPRMGLGMLHKSFSLQHRKSWQHGKYYQSNFASKLSLPSVRSNEASTPRAM